MTFAAVFVAILFDVFLPFVAQGQQGLRIGVAMPHNLSKCEDVQYLGAAWTMNYLPEGPRCLDTENVHMVWGPSQLDALPRDAKIVLEMNEPNYKLPAGWPLTPLEGAILVRAIEAKAPQAFLASPAMSDVNLNWLPQMREAYIGEYKEPPRWNALAVHCYDDWADCRSIIRQHESWARDWGVNELWLTEYATSDLDTASSTISWLRERSNPPTTHVGWFASRQAPGAYGGFPNYALLEYEGPPTPTHYGTWFMSMGD